MLNNSDLKDLATGVLSETLYGSIPLNTAAELAAGVIRLIAECEQHEAFLAKQLQIKHINKSVV